ncbi:Piso0_005711 [Millerozyma farinosa CBS 7064]|uniref:Piso0_005711 protein n=1 Tax=Pichia sorbitophila (strain ATCC MYA-4447 / BCRC 22081 / CBS 7064 / NBRC 10061 / NRRL Y-12695) TaxID=559304 RepID=G8Y2Q1_PICSO|nr:Piso0_005711 [Millerozyma farinosa CBS 7064]
MGHQDGTSSISQKNESKDLSHDYPNGLSLSGSTKDSDNMDETEDKENSNLYSSDKEDQAEHNDKENEKSPSPGGSSNAVASRKRSKVSRACDSCRKKKVRCDAELNSTLQTVVKICSNCVKNNSNCTFSRVPLKRGPSKGYIRELEYRLEGKPGSHQTGYSDSGPSLPPFSVTQAAVPSQMPGQLQNHMSRPVPGQMHIPITGNKPLSEIPPQNSGPPPINNGHGTSVKTSKAGTSPPIILPPLVSTYSNYKSGSFLSNSPTQSFKSNSVDSNSPISHQPQNGGLSSSAASISPRLQQPGSYTYGQQLEGSNPYINSQQMPGASMRKESTPLQGPFWKVPYEMPGLHRASSVDTSSNHNTSFSSSHGRKSSVDSISSTSSTGSKSRFSSLKPSHSVASDAALSDSDDDFYSVRSVKRSRRSSQSVSPRNSVSSMSSLNGRMTRSLNFGQSPQQSFSYEDRHHLVNNTPHLYSQYVPPVVPVFNPLINQSSIPPHISQPIRAPMNNLDQNISLYYLKLHQNFPILPFDQKVIYNIIEFSAEHEHQLGYFLDLFNAALTAVNNYQAQNLTSNVELILQVLNCYPFSKLGVKISDNVLILYFSTLVLVDYAIVMSGDTYSLGLSVVTTMLNDFKVLENFKALCDSKEEAKLSPDNIKLYLPKLFFCMTIIDEYYALAYGVQRTIGSSELVCFLRDNLPRCVPSNIGGHEILNFKMTSVLNEVIKYRDLYYFTGTFEAPFKRDTEIWNIGRKDNFHDQNLSCLIISLLKNKYELIDFLMEIYDLLQKGEFSDEDEDTDDIHDSQLKLVRLVKTLSKTTVILGNYLSNAGFWSSSSQDAGFSGGNEFKNYELLTPLSGLFYSQSIKLIKLSKLIIDSFSVFSDADISARCLKINSDLSVAYTSLNKCFDKSYNPYLGLGQFTTSLIKSKIDQYNLSFAIKQSSQSNNFRMWKHEFEQSIILFLKTEVLNNWY